MFGTLFGISRPARPLESIIAGITGVVGELKALRSEKLDAAEDNRMEIARLDEERDEYMAEANRAASIVAKLEELIS